MTATWTVAQLGARMHYAVPRLLHARGRLSRLFTDICASSGWPRILRALPQVALPGSMRRMRERTPAGIPPSAITSFPLFGCSYARRRASPSRFGGADRVHLWAGREFCRRIIRRGIDDAGGVYAFNSAALELLEHARQRGVRAVVEQTMAPHAFEHQLLAQEAQTHASWTDGGPHIRSDAFADREAKEWSAADTVVCGSSFVVDAITAAGGPGDRCRVVPYGVDLPPAEAIRRSPRAGPLRVLTVGAVGLRKGSPYVMAAAARLGGMATIRMVGPITSDIARSAAAAAGVELTGAVPRGAIGAQYRWADVLLLPSLCEGSATAIYEAMSWGLPVVCTPNAGSVISDGVEGFIVPIRDVEAIVDRLALIADSERTRIMGAAARTRAEDFTIDRYGERLLATLAEPVR